MAAVGSAPYPSGETLLETACGSSQRTVGEGNEASENLLGGRPQTNAPKAHPPGAADPPPHYYDLPIPLDGTRWRLPWRWRPPTTPLGPILPVYLPVTKKLGETWPRAFFALTIISRSTEAMDDARRPRRGT